MTVDARTIYTGCLRNAHAMEEQGLQQMELQISRLERYPEYVALLRRAIEKTRTQISRLEKALEGAGSAPSNWKEAVTTVAGTVAATVHAFFQDETMKNLYAGFAYQHEQIAAYRSLIVVAERAGETAHVATFRQILQEEEQLAKEAAALIEPVTSRYLELTLSGEKADR
jgi:ferritin-like metal-binding protein YciE